MIRVTIVATLPDGSGGIRGTAYTAGNRSRMEARARLLQRMAIDEDYCREIPHTRLGAPILVTTHYAWVD